MKRLMVLGLVVGLGIFFMSAAKWDGKARDSKYSPLAVEKPGSQSPAFVKESPDFGKIPLYFIPNRGQVDEAARFYARTSRYTLWMTKEGLVFDGLGQESRDVSRLVFHGANPEPAMVPLDMTSHRVNYLKGNDPSGWQTNIRTSFAVLYKEVYNNIDLKVYGIERQIEYDWMVKPGGDPAAICFKYRAVKSTRIDEQGDLRVETRLGELVHRRPIAYQQLGGQRQVEVEVRFKKIGEDIYGFETGAYDKGRELVIDPVVMAYSTYLGGTSEEHGFAIAVDGSGQAVVTGDVYSSDFPTQDAYQGSLGGGDEDAFVSKFSASGTSLVFSTYFGGNQSDSGEGIQVDGSGKIYITGWTASTDFPTQGAYQNTNGGGVKDAFVTILSASGGSVVYSTYLGGSGIDQGFALALDSGKNIYVTGRTASADFPTQNAYKASFGGGDYDTFVTKIDTGGSTLAFSTYLGGSGSDGGYGIVVGGSNAYVTGLTGSADFPVKNQYQGSRSGSQDAFLTKFSSSGSSLVYSTYLGGSGVEAAWGIAVNSSGNAYVAGETSSTDFPTQNAYQGTYGGGGKDAFVTQFATTGTTLVYSTFLGGSETDAAAHMVINSEGNAYLTGSTSSSDFPVKRAYQANFNGDYDAFVSMLSASGGSLNFSSYLGGGDFDWARALALDSSGNIYITGYTDSADFPVENAFQSSLSVGMDVFVAKLSTFQLGTLCGAVDNCNLTWTTGGNANWFEQTDTYYYDDDALQSGAVGDSQSSYIRTTVTGPGELNFWWRVSSAYSDYLYFYIDDLYQEAISGTYYGWLKRTYTISPGTHTLKWKYDKNGSYSEGLDCGWLDHVLYIAHFNLVLNRSQLHFGAVSGLSTAAQTFTIDSSLGGTFSWSVADDRNWLSCSPTSGTSAGEVTVTVDPTGLGAGTHTGTITVTSPGAKNSPQLVTVTLEVYQSGKSDVPFGEYATPGNGTTVRSSVPFTGWVLDDLGVQSVKLYRQEGNYLVYIGEAIFVEGARPDVEAAYPDYPDNYKAGWGYMMLTNFLPNGGNGTFTIKAIATDIEGHQVTLGSKTVTVDNAGAVKPFGAIDAPAQGGTASGANYRNQGWVLTPLPNTIPTDGSTIAVYIDGVKLGNPTYNIFRQDIANYFPGYNNSNGAHAYLNFDTTAYANGVHTIQWVVSDNAGNSDGIGSRYFMIRNTSSGSAAAASSNRPPGKKPGPFSFFPAKDLPTEVNDFEPVEVKWGYGDAASSLLVDPDEDGLIQVRMKAADRVEIRFNDIDGRGKNRNLSGWLQVGDQLRPLPVGHWFDPGEGLFRWQPGFCFSGEYRLVFIEKDQYGTVARKDILVRVIPELN